MMLRTIVLAIVLLVLGVAVVSAFFNPETLPAVVMLAILAAALAFERRHYGQAVARPAEEGWIETREQFIDDASGKLVRVWYHPATGARRYVAVGSS